MRVSTAVPVVRTSAGRTSDLVIDVRNTSGIVDEVVARVYGLDGATVTSTPAALQLFPDATGQLALRIELPSTYPAGSHPLVLRAASTLQPSQEAGVDVELVIAESPALRVQVTPARVRSYRRARFSVECCNDGNTPLDVTLAAADDERRVTAELSGAPTRIPPGGRATSPVTVTGPRYVFGSDVDRLIAVTASDGRLAASTTATLRQRPLLTRGLLTAAVLVGIVLLWAGAFLFGLSSVFAGDPLTKTAPATFFATSGSTTLAAVETPDGALPKAGPLPAGVGGVLTGQVRAANTGQGVGRIVVQALRVGVDGPVLFTSAATGTDGDYSLVGLLPGSDYLLRFSATGYTDVFYPDATVLEDAARVRVGAQQTRTGVDAVISGLPASISGTVDTGDDLHPVPVTVTARSLLGANPGSAVATTTTGPGGAFTLPDLPSPDTYQLGFTADGYQPTTTTDVLAGGARRQDPAVDLLAQDGSISGTVCPGSETTTVCPAAAGLGGVTVSTVLAGVPVTTSTPTQGAVGHFTLTGLTTPGTYVVVFALPGYGSRTEVVELAPQQQRNVDVGLSSGAGSVSGTVVGAGQTGPLGGVTVTVGGAPGPRSTVSLTSGSGAGGYTVSGLPVPGSYSLTFSLEGYASVTVPLELTSAAPAPSLPTVTLTPSTGSLSGSVREGGALVGGITVSLTDGTDVRTTVTVDDGGYRFTGLPCAPGPDGTAYTLTVSAPGAQPQTVLVQVRQDSTVRQDVALVGTS